MKTIKISVIGAGSAVFSLGLIKDLCLTEGLFGSRVSLMDIDADRLDVIHKLALRYARELSVDLKFEKTTNLRESLTDADFVINTAYVKGHGYAKDIREVAAKHGYYYYRYPYNIPEPGPPALSNFPQFELMLNVAREMEKVCPEAYLLQASNPVFEGCTLISRETSIKVCGICHGHLGYLSIVATLGLDLDKVTYEAPGFNHCIWLARFTYQGKNAYPLIDEWIETQAEEYWRTHVPFSVFDTQMSRAAVHQYRLYGLFPVGDTVRWGGWWYHTNIDVKKRWYGDPWGGPDTELGRPHHVDMLSKQIEEIKRVVEDKETKVTEARADVRTSTGGIRARAFLPEMTLEQHVPIIDAIVNDHEGQFQVNVPNRGCLEGLPNDVVVEVPAVVNEKGIKPIPAGRLPKKIMLEQILPRWLAMEHVLETYKSGDRNMLLWNVLQHHQTRSYEDAEVLLEDLLSLSDSAEAAAHFKWPKG